MFVEPPAATGPDGASSPEPPLEQLEEEICSLAARIASGTCRYLELVAEFDRRDGWWDSHGMRSMADWLAWRCALTPRAAREHVRVARRLPELPLIHAAFASGQLTYSKVRALTKIASEDSEADLLELAGNATAAQLERIVRAARRVSAEEASDSHERAHCLWSWEPDGSLHLTARLPAEEGAALLAALEASRDELSQRRCEEARAAERAEREDAAEAEAAETENAAEAAETAFEGSAEPARDERRPRAYRRPLNHECLAHLAESAVDRGPSRASPSDAYQVTVHVDAGRLTGRNSDGDCHLDDGPAISPATARRIACDASLLGVAQGPDGEPLAVGRRTRAVPAALRRALELRDRGCRFPGCEQRRHTDAHHILHWASGGETSLSNLILLCRRHHRLCHENGYEISVDERGRPSFRPPCGRPIPAAPALGPLSATSADAPEETARDPGPILTGIGERMNLDYCVEAALAAVR